jgi:hypothetical protein
LSDSECELVPLVSEGMLYSAGDVLPHLGP